MYESPISITQKTLGTSFDEHILLRIEQEIGVHVDKDELVKALEYDREQYQKGYEDGRNSAYSSHEVACILAEFTGDDCPCNFNGIDEWLPNYCDFGKTDICPNPDGVACWEQYLKHKKEEPC